MMGMFGRSARKALEEKLAEVHRRCGIAEQLHAAELRRGRATQDALRHTRRELERSTNQREVANRAVLELTADLRQMDQIVWRMDQCTDWDQMTPFFYELKALTEERMKAESQRIQVKLIPAIVETYGNVIMETYVNADTKSMEAASVSREPSEPARLARPGDATSANVEGRNNESNPERQGDSSVPKDVRDE